MGSHIEGAFHCYTCFSNGALFEQPTYQSNAVWDAPRHGELWQRLLGVWMTRPG
jgi:hypothetical protein